LRLVLKALGGILMADIIIKNGFIITFDQKRSIIKDGGIVIEGNKIIEVDKTEKVLKNYTGEKLIDAKNKVVLPGLINTHNHLFQTLMKSLGDDMKLFDWWPNVIGPLSVNLRKESCYYAALIGSIELIKSGCTCTLDNHYPFPIPELADECIKAFIEVGIRAVEAMGSQDREKPYFPIPKELIMDTEEALKENVKLIERWNGKANGRIHVWFGPGAPFTCSDELLEKAYELSKKYGVGITMHLHESKDEVIKWKEETGYTPIQYYFHKGLRILNSNLLAVHCVWLDDEDIKILAKKKVKVSHNPISNMYLASGIAPIPKLIKAGVIVSLGVDGAASNNNQDMFELMKTTALLHKVASCDPMAITAEKVLEMATIDGAKALGLENEIGSIEVGKKADIILINLKEANMTPLNRIVSQLVYCGKSYNVNTVIIDGKIIMENRQLKSINENEVIEKAQKVADELIERGKRMDMREREWISLPR
jgi:5-methylthioadenosine/S-adenosylhomocysteine deaminase